MGVLRCWVSQPYGYWTIGHLNGLYGGESTIEELPDGRMMYVKDPQAPAVLEDKQILWAVQNDHNALRQFNEMLPNMDPISQQRLLGLKQKYPNAFVLQIDPMVLSDTIQRKEVTAGVHLEIPKPRIRGRLT